MVYLFQQNGACRLQLIKQEVLAMSDEKFVLITDATCDLKEEYYKENGIEVLSLPFALGEKEYENSFSLSPEEFYGAMRNGIMGKTSQISPDKYREAFEKVLSEGKDLLYLAFSSGLSGSYNNARLMAEELSEKYPDRKIRVVDTLAASLGEGLFVHLADAMRKDGKSVDEVADWAEENKLNLCHMFTVDDLMHLHRGGRVSKTVAIAGSILGIKPVLHVDNEGHLIPLSKVRGRKQSLTALVDGMEKRMGSRKNETIAISHGDCLEDAEFVRDLVKKRFGIKSCIINHIGTVIGTHAGPGTVALFFMGDYR